MEKKKAIGKAKNTVELNTESDSDTSFLKAIFEVDYSQPVPCNNNKPDFQIKERCDIQNVLVMARQVLYQKDEFFVIAKRMSSQLSALRTFKDIEDIQLTKLSTGLRTFNHSINIFIHGALHAVYDLRIILGACLTDDELEIDVGATDWYPRLRSAVHDELGLLIQEALNSGVIDLDNYTRLGNLMSTYLRTEKLPAYLELMQAYDTLLVLNSVMYCILEGLV